MTDAMLYRVMLLASKYLYTFIYKMQKMMIQFRLTNIQIHLLSYFWKLTTNKITMIREKGISESILDSKNTQQWRQKQQQ